MKKITMLIACACLAYAGVHAQRTLKGKLYFKQEFTDAGQRAVKGTSSINYPAANVKVVLINRDDSTPDRNNAAQKRVYETIQSPEFDCQASLSSLKYKWTITNAEGYYFFKDVPAGKYIVKVCGARGNFYKFTITTNNYRYLFIPDLAARQ